MKKALLATTAIAGVALALQPAQAQETKFSIDGKVELGINYSTAEVVDKTKGISGEKADKTFYTKATDKGFTLTAPTPEIHVNASREVAPGITTGMHIEFDTGTANAESTAVLDEFSGYIEGSFGKVEMGYQDGAADQLGNHGYAGGGHGVLNGDAKKFESNSSLRTVSTEVGQDHASGDDLKISYFTPELAGFKAGVSYAYRGYKLDKEGENALYSNIEVGAAYNRDFGSAGSLKSGLGFSVDLDPSPISNKGQTDANTNMGVRVGGIYSIAGADIGLGVSAAIRADKTQATPIHIQASVKYTLPNLPLDVGAGFGYGLGLGTVEDKGLGSEDLAASAWAAGAGIGYNIFDGVRATLDVVYSTSSVEIAKDTTQDTGEIGVLANFALSF